MSRSSYKLLGYLKRVSCELLGVIAECGELRRLSNHYAFA